MPEIKPPELSSYKIIDLVGSGGMGSVYIARQRNTGKKVAVKFLDPEAAQNKVLLKQFEQEGNILRELEHPNIVGFVAQGEIEGFHYIVMDYVNGLSLEKLPLGNSSSTDIKTPTIEEYINIFKGCFEALSYIHKKGLIHRDIKPQNIILRGNEYKPCLLDFGISGYIDQEDDLNINPDRMFTVVYASPEQLTNKPVDSLSDLFSLGVVMYEKLTGRLPFKGTKAMEIFVEQTKWKFPHPRQLNPNIPKKLEQIILKLLTKDPTYRYPTADMVIGELDRLLEVAILGQKGLTLSNIISDIKGLTTETEKKGFKKRTIYDEQILLKKQRAELLDARQKLRIEMSRNLPDNSKIDSYKELCDTLQEEYNRTESQIKMVLGFKSEPLVIDKFNTIFKLETIAFEKRGIPFTINTLEQKLTNTDGEEIIVGSINFTEKAKRIFTNKQNTSSLSTEGNQWYFSPFEEKELPILLLVGNQEMPTPPQGFKGFFWPKEFLIAIKKLNWTGVSISEIFKGIDRSGREVYAEHKETIFFSQSLLDQI